MEPSSETPTKRKRGRPPGSGSGSKKEKEGPSRTTSAETTPTKDFSPNLTPLKIKEEEPSLTPYSETPTKRKRGRPPGSGSGSTKEGPSLTTSAEITPTKRSPGRPTVDSVEIIPHVIQLNAGKDVVDVIYNMSVANPHKTVAILSAHGSISEIVNLTPNSPRHRKGEYHLMSLKWPIDDNVRRCREKAMCTITCTNPEGYVFANTAINSLIVAGRVDIIVALFDTDTAKKTGTRILDFGIARNDERNPIAATPLQMIKANMDPAREYSTKAVKEEGCSSGYLPTTPTVGDGNIINPTSATTSASNDQDMKSPSVEDMKSPSVGDT